MKAVTEAEVIALASALAGSGGGGSGDGDMKKSVYDTDNNGIVDNAEKVNNHTVAKDVPANAVFTDTVYDDTALSGRVTAIEGVIPSGATSSNKLATASDIPAAQIQSDYDQSDNTKLDYIKNKPTLGTAAAKNSTNAVTDGSTALVESGAVKTAIDAALSSVYKPSGDKTVAQLTSSLLIASNLGNVYNVTDSGTTTADFVGGAGKTINVGDNVAVVDIGSSTYKFDLLSGFVDLSNYPQKSSTAGLIKNDGTIDTTAYQDSTDKMTAADMNDVITPLPVARDNFQEYSTGEQVVGKWIDGKPIYQKTFSGTVASTSTSLFSVSSLSPEHFINIRGNVVVSGYQFSIPYYQSQSSMYDVFYYDENIEWRSSSNSSTDYWITIQYTKTTD